MASQLESSVSAPSPETHGAEDRPSGKRASSGSKSDGGKGTPGSPTSRKWKLLPDKVWTPAHPLSAPPRLASLPTEGTGVAAVGNSQTISQGGWKHFWEATRAPPSPSSPAKGSVGGKRISKREESKEALGESLPKSTRSLNLDEPSPSCSEGEIQVGRPRMIRRRASYADFRNGDWSEEAPPISDLGNEEACSNGFQGANEATSPASEPSTTPPSLRRSKGWFSRSERDNTKTPTASARPQGRSTFSVISSSSPLLGGEPAPPIGPFPIAAHHPLAHGAPGGRGGTKKEKLRPKAAPVAMPSETCDPAPQFTTAPARIISTARQLYRKSSRGGAASFSCPMDLPETSSLPPPDLLPFLSPEPMSNEAGQLRSTPAGGGIRSPKRPPPSRLPIRILDGILRGRGSNQPAAAAAAAPTPTVPTSRVFSSPEVLDAAGTRGPINEAAQNPCKHRTACSVPLPPPSQPPSLIIPPTGSPETSGSLVATPQTSVTDNEHLTHSPNLSSSNSPQEVGKVQQLFRSMASQSASTSSAPLALSSSASLRPMPALFRPFSPSRPKSPPASLGFEGRSGASDRGTKESSAAMKGGDATTAATGRSLLSPSSSEAAASVCHSSKSSPTSDANSQKEMEASDSAGGNLQLKHPSFTNGIGMIIPTSTSRNHPVPGGTPPDLPSNVQAAPPTLPATPSRGPSAKRALSDSFIPAKTPAPISGRRVNSSEYLREGEGAPSGGGIHERMKQGDPPAAAGEGAAQTAPLTFDLLKIVIPISSSPCATDSLPIRHTWRTPSGQTTDEDTDDGFAFTPSRASSNSNSSQYVSRASSTTSEHSGNTVAASPRGRLGSAPRAPHASKWPIADDSIPCVDTEVGPVSGGEAGPVSGGERGEAELLHQAADESHELVTSNQKARIPCTDSSGGALSARFAFNPSKSYVSSSTPLLGGEAVHFNDTGGSPLGRTRSSCSDEESSTESEAMGENGEPRGPRALLGGDDTRKPRKEKSVFTGPQREEPTRGKSPTARLDSDLCPPWRRLPLKDTFKEVGTTSATFSHASLVRISSTRLSSFRGIPPPVPEDSVMRGDEVAEDPQAAWQDNSSIKALLEIAKAAQAAKEKK